MTHSPRLMTHSPRRRGGSTARTEGVEGSSRGRLGHATRSPPRAVSPREGLAGGRAADKAARDEAKPLFFKS